MILQALTKLYEDLTERGENVPVPGYSNAAVSAIVQIDLNGNLVDIIPANIEDIKKKIFVKVPMQQKRSGKCPPPYFVCDNAQYVFGREKDGVTEKSKSAFSAFRQYHHKMLDGVCAQEVIAFLNFVDNWEPEKEAENEIVLNSQGCLNGSLVFRILETSKFLHDVPEIIEVWNQFCAQEEDDIYGMCLVTGTIQPIARTHSISIKGIRSDSPAPNGWTLVGFNEDAFCSYGKKQSYNAPVGKYAAFAYTAALNYLLSKRDNVQRVGDTSIVCWAEGAEPQYQELAYGALFGQEIEGFSDDDLYSAVKRLAEGLPCEELSLDPNKTFYILGLAPNAARLSVRFFLRNSFGSFMKNINDHHERMKIIRPSFDTFETIPLWTMLRETVNMNSRDKSPSPVMAGAVTRAIFTGGLYPASLLEAVMIRIRAEHNISRGKAAIIKAYYMKNRSVSVPEEVLQVSLNEQSTNIPYLLGRLFSVYEALQDTANPGINATIRDKYFNSAASIPATIFPILGNLAQKHLRKLSTGSRIFYDKQISEIKSMLGESYPTRLSLPEQGSFDLGYYHQTQKRYEKKEK